MITIGTTCLYDVARGMIVLPSGRYVPALSVTRGFSGSNIATYRDGDIVRHVYIFRTKGVK